MMVIKCESSDQKSNALICVNSMESNEKKEDASAFLALLKSNEPETATNNTDTFEFSFQMQTENDENASSVNRESVVSNLTSLSDDSLNSNTVSSYLAKNYARKSIGLTERFHNKNQQLKQEFDIEKLKAELLSTTVVDESQQNEAQQVINLINLKTNDQTKPMIGTLSTKCKDEVTINASILMDITLMGTYSNGDEEGLNLDDDDDGSSNGDLKHILDAMSRSIHNSIVLNETSQLDISKSSLALNTTQAQIKRIPSFTFDFTKNNAFLRNASFEEPDLVQFRFSSLNDSLYQCISKLNVNALHIRVHSMRPNICIVRYLWGTVEVRIYFDPASNHIQPKSFHTYSSLSRKKDIPNKVMRGLEDRALFNGDDMFLSFNEKHRPILFAHNYVLSHIHDKYDNLIDNRFLVNELPDSTKLSNLLTQLSNIANAARKIAVELRHICSREITQIHPPDEDGKFRFSVVLLCVRLNSSFEVLFTFDPLLYPEEVIHPTIVVPDKDKHLYGTIEQFNAALLLVETGNFNYLTNLIRGARLYIKAIRAVLLHNRRLNKQNLCV